MLLLFRLYVYYKERNNVKLLSSYRKRIINGLQESSEPTSCVNKILKLVAF